MPDLPGSTEVDRDLDAEIAQLESRKSGLVTEFHKRRRIAALKMEVETLEVMIEHNDQFSFIISMLAFHRGCSIKELLGKLKDEHLAYSRMLLAYFCRLLLGMKMRRIAHLIGYKDHGSVVYACQKIEDKMSVEIVFRKEVEVLKERLTKGLIEWENLERSALPVTGL